MASSVPACVEAFILSILCGNPILKGAFVTILNSLVAKISLDIDLLTLQIARLNIINQITSLGINTLNAVFSKVKADFNLLLGPLQNYPDCGVMSDISRALQDNAVGAKLAAFKKKVYNFNRATNLIRVLDAIKRKKEQQIQTIQDVITKISELC